MPQIRKGIPLSHIRILAHLLPVSLLFFQSCLVPPELIRTGTVSVNVIDEFHGPVADVEIHLEPSNIDSKTDKGGSVVLQVLPGDYFVDANVCCIGPGFIVYHLPITVRVGETTTVELKACLSCL